MGLLLGSSHEIRVLHYNIVIAQGEMECPATEKPEGELPDLMKLG